ncbi:MAG: hypothetical protein GWP30_10745, partial [Actinobacteria bacterium]|nr:hypothetical protein [Actinomycetota bacterium]
MMKSNLLWPAMRWPDGYEAEIETAGDDADCVFVKSPELVSDEQWSSCDAIISTADPISGDDFEKIGSTRILVTPKVGFDNIDLAAWGARGIPVCNV